MKSLVVLSLLVASSTAVLFNDDPDWNGLTVGYGLFKFDHLPRTVNEATEDDWVPDRNASNGCDGTGSYFAGNRYIKDNDPGAMLLFDINGYIAGIQAGIPKTRTEEYPAPQNAQYHVFNEEDNMWVVTAYFVEPDTICSEGRTSEQFNSQGTGYMLAFQNGSSPDNLKRIPMREDKVLSTTEFVEGRCFVGMGMHYWYDRYNEGENMSCDDTFPAFLLYDSDGLLTGFGWAFNLNFGKSSYRWEHPLRATYRLFMKNPPECLGKEELVTSLHVFFTQWPQTHLCL